MNVLAREKRIKELSSELDLLKSKNVNDLNNIRKLAEKEFKHDIANIVKLSQIKIKGNISLSVDYDIDLTIWHLFGSVHENIDGDVFTTIKPKKGYGLDEFLSEHNMGNTGSNPFKLCPEVTAILKEREAAIKRLEKKAKAFAKVHVVAISDMNQILEDMFKPGK